MPEILTSSDSHTIDQKEGDIEGGGLTAPTVPTFEAVKMAPIVEVEKLNNLKSENYQIMESENVDEPQQNLEPTKTAASFRFQVGDRVINPKRPNLSLEVVSIEPDGEWCHCKDDYGIELYACRELVPDEF